MIGIAIIGLGNALEPHAKALAELKGRARVVWGVGRTQARAESAAAQWGYRPSTDMQAAIADRTVDAVLVLTPANTHLPFAQAAFAAGKHVLCEKPLETTVARGEALIATGRAARRRLGIMLQLRLRTASQRLKVLLDQGALGPIQCASMTVPWWRPQSYYDEPGRGVLERDGGGVLMTQAIHTLDLFRWFVGIERVEAAQIRTTCLHRMETEDYAGALVRLGNGAPGSILATVAAYPGSPETITIIGQDATARMEGANLQVDWLDGRQEKIEDSGGSGSGPRLMGFSHEPHKRVILDFLDAIEQDRDPAIPGEEALATQRVIDAIIAKGG
jgi:predicted dehydrogenase